MEIFHIEEEAMLAQWRAEYAISMPWVQHKDEDEDEGGES